MWSIPASAAGNEKKVKHVVLASLAALLPCGSACWCRAVAPAVTALGAIVNNYIDVTGVRIAPTYDAVIRTLQHCGLGGKVPEFQAVWEELRGTSDGRAVITMCEAAAEGKALLGRLYRYLTKMADDPELGDELAARYKKAAFLPVQVAAERYYRSHAAPPPAIEAAPPEWPSLHSLYSYRYALPYGGHPPQKWLLAVAPAMTVWSASWSVSSMWGRRRWHLPMT